MLIQDYIQLQQNAARKVEEKIAMAYNKWDALEVASLEADLEVEKNTLDLLKQVADGTNI
jgi:hypothetical protein